MSSETLSPLPPKPRVSLEDHKLMAAHGIALRPNDAGDGWVFGFKKPCHRKGCQNKADQCYCAGTLEAAVAASKMRSAYSCGRECWFQDDSAWDHYEIEEYVMESAHIETLLSAFGIDDPEDEPGPKCRRILADDWRARIKAEWPDLWRLLQEEYGNDADWDDEPDEGECGCEV